MLDYFPIHAQKNDTLPFFSNVMMFVMLSRHGRDKAWIGLWFLAVVVAYLGPTLIGKAIFALDADLAIYYYPVLNFYGTALHTGQSFLWMPGIFSGFPIYLSQSGGFLDPVNIILFRIFESMTAMHSRLAIDFFITFVASYFAARALGMSRTAALLVGPSYLLAIHGRHLTNPIVANTLFLFPLLIYTAQSVLRGVLTPLRAGLIAGVGLGWALLGGYTQVIVYAIFFSGLLIVGQMLLQRTEWLARIKRLSLYGVLTIVLGALISLPFILPAQKFLPLSARSIKATFEQATLKAVAPGDLVLTLVPDYLYFPYVTSGRIPMYVGALWFMLAVGAVILAIRALRRRPMTDAHSGIIVSFASALFALVAAFKSSPIFWAMTFLPVVGLFRFPFRFMFIGAFLLALLGGYGFDLMQKIVPDRVWKWFLWGVSAGTTFFALFIIVLKIGGDTLIRFLADVGHILLGATVYGRLGFTKDPEKYRFALENGLQAYREFFSISDFGVCMGVGALVAACALLMSMTRGWVTFEKGRKLCIYLVVAGALLIPASQWTRFVTREEVGMRPQALASYVGKDISLYRMFSFLPVVGAGKVIPPQYKLDALEEAAVHDVWITGSIPNFHLYSGIATVDGYDQFESLDYLEAVYSFGGEHQASYGAGTQEERILRLQTRLDIFGMMGGRYIVTGVELAARDLTLLGTTSASEYDIPVYVYEYKKARPIYYFATTTVARPHASFKELRETGLTFERNTYLDCKDCAARVTTSARLYLIERKNGRYVFGVESPEERMLVLSESYLPGWTLTIDGQNAAPVRTNGIYMAARVPAGEHTVVFEYQGLMNELRWMKALELVR